MAVLTEFLRGVLEAGRLELREPLPNRDEPAALLLLTEAYRWHARTVAGPPLAFDGAIALAAGRVLYQAGWYFLNAQAVVERTTLQLAEPKTPAQHLSADLLLRYLPTVHRRARALRPTDELTALLADLLRRWPLSGVLADIDEAPTTAVDFAGHAGLQLLYAERLAHRQRPAWLPPAAALGTVELVWHDLGRDPALVHLLQRSNDTSVTLE